MLVLTAVLFAGLLVMAVLAIDFTRVIAQRNELHTASDAGSLAGAVQLLQSQSTAALDTALALAQVNAPAGAPGATAELGRWVDSTAAFSATSADSANAVRVGTSDSTRYLVGRLFNMLPVTLHRTSTAWATAPVIRTGCVRPWAMPYDSLLAKLTGAPPATHQLTTGDIGELLRLDPSLRRVRLRLASGSAGPVAGTYTPLVIGANGYRQNLFDTQCDTHVGLEDVLAVQPDPLAFVASETIEGIRELCEYFGTYVSLGDVAECRNASGSLGLPMKVVLYGSDFTSGGSVRVHALAGFVLDSIFLTNVPGGGGHEIAEVIGHFAVVASTGIVGSTANSALVRPILVQ